MRLGISAVYGREDIKFLALFKAERSSGRAGADEALHTLSSFEHCELDGVIRGLLRTLVQDGPDDLCDETGRNPILKLRRQGRRHFSPHVFAAAARDVAGPQGAGATRGAKAAVLNQGNWRGRCTDASERFGMGPLVPH